MTCIIKEKCKLAKQEIYIIQVSLGGIIVLSVAISVYEKTIPIYESDVS